MYNKQTDILEYKKFKIENLFNKFSQQKYIIDFVKENLIFLGVSGSYAYGMETETSDLDVIGIFKDNIDMILGYEKVDQIEYKDEQLNITIYSLSKALKLIIEQNPNCLELIFLDESDILYSLEDYWQIRWKRDLMISKLSKHKFTGYAMSQMKRIQGHEKYIVQEQAGNFEHKPEMIDFCRIIKTNGTTLRDKKDLEVHMKFSFLTHETNTIFKMWNDVDFIENINGWFDNENYTFRFKENKPKESIFAGLLFFAKDEFNQALDRYSKWKTWKENRNIKRHELEQKYAYDTKHASHLFRLLKMGLEILETKQVNIKRPDANFLKDIRNGKYTYEWIISEAERYDKVLILEAYEKSDLRNSVDNKIYIEIMRGILKI